MIADITYFILDYNPRCNLDATKYLNACMSSLYANRNTSIVSDVYIIDQGNPSTDYKNKLADKCSQYNFNFISLDHNKGIAGGINFASRLSKSKHLCLVTSDTTFTPNLDTILLEELEAHNDIQQITPAVDRGDVPYQVRGHTTDLKPIRCIAQELTIQCWKREAFDLIGYWDERWTACYENLDYALRLFLSGNSSAITHKIMCHHEHGTTYKNGSLSDAYNGNFDHNILRGLWNQKWPGLDWHMMYDLNQYTGFMRTTLFERYQHNIKLQCKL